MVFQIKARAVLLTYNYDDAKFGFSEFCHALIGKLHASDRYTICEEVAGSRHFHAFVERLTQIDCTADVFEVFGAKPNVQTNTIKGSGFRPSADRGHFYAFCEYKSSHVDSESNYQPIHHYVVKAKWLLDLWKLEILRALHVPCAVIESGPPSTDGQQLWPRHDGRQIAPGT